MDNKNKPNNTNAKAPSNNHNDFIRKRLYNNNGYRNNNKYNQNSNNDNVIANTLRRLKEKQKKETAKKAIVAGANAINPVAGAAAKTALDTPKGEKYLDAYAKGDSPTQGINNVKQEVKKDLIKTRIIMLVGGFVLPILFLMLIILPILKSADSQIYSNDNNGKVDEEFLDDKDANVFANYPGLYQKVGKIVDEYSDKYQLELDKYLIIATLIAPIENNLITPVDDNSCGEEECYYFNDKSYTWEKFLDVWADQATLLAKMQMLAYGTKEKLEVECNDIKTMEQYAQNDKAEKTRHWYDFINPINWFTGFENFEAAEINGVCTEAPDGKYEVPIVYVKSTEQGEYYKSITADGSYEYIKDPNSGGVYFWNLVNEKGFIHEYLKDYLSDENIDNPSLNYEINLDRILETANDIYSYYDTITKQCDGYYLLESSVKTITVEGVGEIDFDQYVGGVVLAEFNSGNLEATKAQAILARSYALSEIGLDGGKNDGSIENSSNRQNYNPSYSPEAYPKIAQAIEETKGLIVTDYLSADVKRSEYDAFCPTMRELDDGFYYLDDEQGNLPINPGAYYSKTGQGLIREDSRYLDCPCFQNKKSRPTDEVIDGKGVRYSPISGVAPTCVGGEPPQETKDICWKEAGVSRQTKVSDLACFKDRVRGNGLVEDGYVTEYGWTYDPSGGHGRGASQIAMKYFAELGYDQDALIRLFYRVDSSGTPYNSEGHSIANIKRISTGLQENQCRDISYYGQE